MSQEQRESHAAMTSEPVAGMRGPRWRALLEARWQARVREVTELSLAYHVAAAATPGGTGTTPLDTWAIRARSSAWRSTARVTVR